MSVTPPATVPHELSDDRFPGLFERAAEGIFWTDVDGRTLQANPAMARMLAYDSPAQLLAEVPNASTLYPVPELREELVGRLLEQSKLHDVELEVRRRDGRTVWLSISAHVLADEAGAPAVIEGFATDITSRRRDTDELRRREAILGALADLAEGLLNQGRGEVDIAAAIGQLAGAADADRATVLEVVAAADGVPAVRRRDVWAAPGVPTLDRDPNLEEVRYEEGGFADWAAALAAGETIAHTVDDLAAAQRALVEPFSTQAMLLVPIHVDGTWWGALVIEDVHGGRSWSPAETAALKASGRILGAALAHQAVWDELVERDRRMTAFVEAVPAGIVFVERDGQISFANSRSERILGLPRAHIASRSIADPDWAISRPDGSDLAIDELPFAQVMGGEAVQDVRLALRRGDGTRIQLSVNGVPRLDRAGRVTGMFATIDDISERHAAELVRNRLAALVAASSDAVLAKDRDGVVTDWNPAAEEIYGYTATEAIGRPLHALVVPDGRQDELRDLYARVLAGETIRSHETERVRADGTRIWVSLGSAPIRDETGVVGISTIARDITDQVRLRQEFVIHAEELARSNRDLEQFAYVASHDLQEPLRMVTSFVQLLARRYEGQLDEQADEYIHFAVDGANRMKGLIDDLLSYSRVGTQGGDFAPTDLAAIAATVLDDLRQAIADSGGSVHVDPLPVVDGDPGQLQQLLQNLVSNAIKFHGDAPATVHVSVERRDDEWEFSVSDNGIGISAEHHDRVFVIFQRLHTREHYPGTGIGLAICKRIVERHGGRIWIVPTGSPGTTVRFTLPTETSRT